MTLLNIHVSDSAIVCLTDTLTFLKDEPCGFVPWKCWIFPKADMALASRGSIGLFLEIIDAAFDFEESYSGDVEPFVKRCEHALNSTMNDDFHKGGGDFSLYIMRLDHETRKPHVIHVSRKYRELACINNICSGYIVRPYIKKEIFDRLPRQCSPEILKRIALAQWRVNVELLDGGNCIGGLMHMTKLDNNGVSRSVIGSFPDFPDTARGLGLSHMTNAGEHEIALKELEHGKK